MKTKPVASKRRFISHSDDFSDKEVYSVVLKPFRDSNGKELVDLSISARSSFAVQNSMLVLHPSQLNALEVAIKEYQSKSR